MGVGVTACAACCAVPLLSFLGGLSVAGAVGSLVIGAVGLAVAIGAGAAYLVVRRRRLVRCGTETPPSVPIAGSTRRP